MSECRIRTLLLTSIIINNNNNNILRQIWDYCVGSFGRRQFEHSKMYRRVHLVIIFTTKFTALKIFILYLNQRESFEKEILIQGFCFVLKDKKNKINPLMS